MLTICPPTPKVFMSLYESKLKLGILRKNEQGCTTCIVILWHPNSINLSDVSHRAAVHQHVSAKLIITDNKGEGYMTQGHFYFSQSHYGVWEQRNVSSYRRSRQDGWKAKQTNMEQADWVHPGWDRLCCGSGKHLEISLSLLQEWRRWEQNDYTCYVWKYLMFPFQIPCIYAALTVFHCTLDKVIYRGRFEVTITFFF